jgi:hypothetical protein
MTTEQACIGGCGGKPEVMVDQFSDRMNEMPKHHRYFACHPCMSIIWKKWGHYPNVNFQFQDIDPT